MRQWKGWTKREKNAGNNQNIVRRLMEGSYEEMVTASQQIK